MTQNRSRSLIAASCGQIAQSVEQRIENPCVGSSILPLATMSMNHPVKPTPLVDLIYPIIDFLIYGKLLSLLFFHFIDYMPNMIRFTLRKPR